jgi:putative ABC transport system permease protein
MSVLDRKLVRDLKRLWMQLLAIALVLACGAAAIITSVGAYRSLNETRAAFYERYRFATVFAAATRAPMTLGVTLAAIDGVSAVELRVAKSVIFDIEGMAEPATGLAISMPRSGDASVNRLYLRAGRWPDPDRAELAVLASFAEAHSLAPGSRLSAVMNGRKRTWTVAGIVLSPEYIYAVGPGDIVPDERRFGVVFVPRKALEGIFEMSGAFNDLVMRTQRGARLDDVIDRVDILLRPYGGTGASPRKEQISHAFLENELIQLRAMAAVMPPVFLFVSAFLVNMVLTRLVALEREQVGLLKAVGYGSSSIAWHYGKLTLAVATVGVTIGAISGNLLGRGLTRLYGEFYSFPFLVFREGADLHLISACVCVAAALGGSVRAIHGVVRLPPAVAMQPPAPPVYRSLFAASQVRLPISQLTLMAIRDLVRWPVRAGLAMLGTSFAVALLVTALFSFDSVEAMIDIVFFRTERQDATLSFTGAKAPDALQAVARLSGVTRVEGFQREPVVLRNGHHTKRLAITTVSPEADLVQALDLNLRAISIPQSGLTISERVAVSLNVGVGETLEVELLEHPGRSVRIPVTSIIQSYIGMAAYMGDKAFDRLIGRGPRVSGARISIDVLKLKPLYAQLKKTPAIGGIALQMVSRQKFQETIEQNITTMTSVYVALATIITFGVVYNSARIQLSERARDLASLRIMGFTRGEVSRVLLSELAVIVWMAQPVGWAVGAGLSWSVVSRFDSDLFRIPFVIERSTFAMASAVVCAIALLSALVVRARIDRLDLVRVIKTRD